MVYRQDKNKIFVKINQDAVKKLAKLASPHEIEPDLLLKVIEHAVACDKWELVSNTGVVNRKNLCGSQ